MVMNGFDTNLDGENEVYAVNTVAFHYQHHPIAVRQGELTRVYLVNVTEFDLLNSFHLQPRGIGLHNLGEGLAIGTSYATGEIALGTFLVVGFLLHNTTEGLGIGHASSRSADQRPGLPRLLLLGAMAGVPTVLGRVAGRIHILSGLDHGVSSAPWARGRSSRWSTSCGGCSCAARSAGLTDSAATRSVCSFRVWQLCTRPGLWVPA